MYDYTQPMGFNPYQMRTPMLPRTEVIHVNGRPGADAFQLAPNSSALLLDEHEPIVWLIQTDGAGYKTVSPYSITPYEPEQAPDLGSLEERIRRLEERINESNNAKPAKKQPAAE